MQKVKYRRNLNENDKIAYIFVFHNLRFVAIFLTPALITITLLLSITTTCKPVQI